MEKIEDLFALYHALYDLEYQFDPHLKHMVLRKNASVLRR